jgi:dipeptidyl aminopeptidase/acylaminoacyl peptidase
MTLSHQEAFELLQRGMDARPFRPVEAELSGATTPADRFQAQVLAGLEPEARAQLEAHWETCPQCRADLGLAAQLRLEAARRWPLQAASKDSPQKIAHRARTQAARRQRIRRPLQTAVMMIVLAGALLALQWILGTLRPQLVNQPAPGTPRVIPRSTTTPTQPTQPAPSSETLSTPLPATSISPFLTGELPELGEWSPDGRYLVISQPQGTVSDPQSDRQYTSFSLLDSQSGELCPLGEPFQGQWAPHQQAAWLPDGRLLLTIADQVLLYSPCNPQPQDVSEFFNEPVIVDQRSSKEAARTLLSGESAYWVFDPFSINAFKLPQPAPDPRGRGHIYWSPSGQTLAISLPAVTGSNQGQIYLVDVLSGQVLETISVPGASPDSTSWVDWVLEDTLVVNGPGHHMILVERSPSGPARQRVMDELAVENLQPGAQVMAYGTLGEPQRSVYHVFVVLQSGETRTVYLYHREDERIEVLDQESWMLLIFPDGQTQSLNILDDNPPFTAKCQIVWVDQPDRAPQEIVAAGHTPRNHPDLWPQWIPEREQLIFASSQGVSLMSARTNTVVEFWRLEGSENSDYTAASLSPDHTSLVAQTSFSNMVEGGLVGALYLIHLPTD